MIQLKIKRFDNKGIASFLIWGGILGLAAIGGVWGVSHIAEPVARQMASGMAGLINLILPFVGQIFQWLGGLCANLINIFAVLNPFDANTLAPFLWNTFKNIAYIVIIFMGLYAGFLYIIDSGKQGQDLIMKLIVVALVISFTFIAAKEIFYVSFVITKNLASLFSDPEKTAVCQYGNCVGTAIHTSLLSFVNPGISQDLANSISSQMQAGGDSNAELMKQMYELFGNLVMIILYFIYTTIMFIFAGLFVGRFVMITFLVGLLPLSILAWSMPKYGSKWDEWMKLFVQWTINIPVVLILVLIGFSIVSVGLSGDSFIQKFSEYSDVRLIGERAGTATPQAYAGLIRYFFIVAYYAFVIHYAQKIGGGAATFGVNFAKGSYLALGGAIAGAGKLGFKPVRAGIGEKVENWGDKLAGSGITGTYNIGKTMRNLGESMQKGKKEHEEEIAKGKIAQIKNEPDKIRKYIQDLIKGKKYGVLKNVIDSDKIGWDTEEWIRQISQVKDVLDDKKARVLLSKKWKGFGIDSSDPQGVERMAEALASIDMSSAGKWNDVKMIPEQLGFTAPGSSADDVLRQAWTRMSPNRQMSFASMAENFDTASNLTFTTDTNFIRGFVRIPALGDMMREGLGTVLTLISQGRIADADTEWARISALGGPLRTAATATWASVPTSIQNFINTSLLSRLTSLPTPTLP